MAKEFEEDPFKDYMRTEEEMLKARKTEGKETALATMEAKDDAKVLVGEGLEGDLEDPFADTMISEEEYSKSYLVGETGPDESQYKLTPEGQNRFWGDDTTPGTRRIFPGKTNKRLLYLGKGTVEVTQSQAAKFVDNIKRHWQSGRKSTELHLLGYEAVFTDGPPSKEVQAEITRLQRTVKQLQLDPEQVRRRGEAMFAGYGRGPEGPWDVPEMPPPEEGYIEWAANLVAEQIPVLTSMFYDGLVGAGATTSGVFLSPTTPQQKAALLMPAVTIGGATGALHNAFKQMTGAAYIEYSQITNEKGERLPDVLAKMGAVLSGAAGTGLEAFPWAVLGKLLGLSKILTKSGVRRTEALKIPTTKGALVSLLWSVHKMMLAEGWTEGSQEGTQALTANMLMALVNSLHDGEFKLIDAKEVLARIAMSALAGGVLGGVIPLPFLTGKAFSDISKAVEISSPVDQIKAKLWQNELEWQRVEAERRSRANVKRPFDNQVAELKELNEKRKQLEKNLREEMQKQTDRDVKEGVKERGEELALQQAEKDYNPDKVTVADVEEATKEVGNVIRNIVDERGMEEAPEDDSEYVAEQIFDTLEELEELAKKKGADPLMPGTYAFTDAEGVSHIPSERLANELGIDIELVRDHEASVRPARALIEDNPDTANAIIAATEEGDAEAVHQGTIDYYNNQLGKGEVKGINRASIEEEIVTRELALQALDRKAQTEEAKNDADVAKVQKALEPIGPSPETRKKFIIGRLKKIDSDIKAIDNQVAAFDREIALKLARKEKTKSLEKRKEVLLNQRGLLGAEQSSLGVIAYANNLALKRPVYRKEQKRLAKEERKAIRVEEARLILEELVEGSEPEKTTIRDQEGEQIPILQRSTNPPYLDRDLNAVGLAPGKRGKPNTRNKSVVIKMVERIMEKPQLFVGDLKAEDLFKGQPAQLALAHRILDLIEARLLGEANRYMPGTGQFDPYRSNNLQPDPRETGFISNIEEPVSDRKLTKDMSKDELVDYLINVDVQQHENIRWGQQSDNVLGITAMLSDKVRAWADPEYRFYHPENFKDYEEAALRRVAARIAGEPVGELTIRARNIGDTPKHPADTNKFEGKTVSEISPTQGEAVDVRQVEEGTKPIAFVLEALNIQTDLPFVTVVFTEVHRDNKGNVTDTLKTPWRIYHRPETEAAAKELKAIYEGIDKRRQEGGVGSEMTDEEHQQIGTLLGFSETDINKFIESRIEPTLFDVVDETSEVFARGLKSKAEAQVFVFEYFSRLEGKSLLRGVGGQQAAPETVAPVNLESIKRWPGPEFFEGEGKSPQTSKNVVVEAYHGTMKGKMLEKDTKKFGGVHVGTQQAAQQRVQLEIDGARMRGGKKVTANVFPVRVSLKKALGTFENPISETFLFYTINLPGRRAELIEQGFDGIIYTNTVEDRGKVSVLSFFSKNVEVLSKPGRFEGQIRIVVPGGEIINYDKDFKFPKASADKTFSVLSEKGEFIARDITKKEVQRIIDQDTATKPENLFKTSDISIHKDSVGAFTATHKKQGLLIDSDFFDTRQEARKAAVEALREKQELAEIEEFEREQEETGGIPAIKPIEGADTQAGRRKLADDIYENFSEEKKTTIRERLIAIVTGHFGKTYNTFETGYIMPDGTGLDLSGRHEMPSEYKKEGDVNVMRKPGRDYMIGERHTDHRDLPEALYTDKDILSYANQLTGFEQDGPSNTDIMDAFMRMTGVIRVSAWTVGKGALFVDLSAVDTANITDAQWDKIHFMQQDVGTSEIEVEFPGAVFPSEALSQPLDWADIQHPAATAISNVAQLRSIIKTGSSISNIRLIQTNPPLTIKGKGDGDFYVRRVGNDAGKVFRKRQGPNDIAIAVNQKAFDPNYIFYLFQSLYPKLNAKKRGTAQQAIRQEDINNVIIEYFNPQNRQDWIALKELVDSEGLGRETLFKVFTEGKRARTSGKKDITDRQQVAAGIKILIEKGFLPKGTTNLDLGGGLEGLATKLMKEKNAGKNKVLDTSRTKKLNKDVIDHFYKNPADSATLMNLLNIIEDKGELLNALKQAKVLVKEDGRIYIQVYEGPNDAVFPQDHPNAGQKRKGSGVGYRSPRTGSWQRNQTLGNYKPFVDEVFGKENVVMPADEGGIQGLIIIENRKEAGVDVRRKLQTTDVFEKEHKYDLTTGEGLTQYDIAYYKGELERLDREVLKFEKKIVPLEKLLLSLAKYRSERVAADLSVEKLDSRIEQKTAELDQLNLAVDIVFAQEQGIQDILSRDQELKLGGALDPDTVTALQDELFDLEEEYKKLAEPLIEERKSLSLQIAAARKGNQTRKEYLIKQLLSKKRKVIYQLEKAWKRRHPRIKEIQDILQLNIEAEISREVADSITRKGFVPHPATMELAKGDQFTIEETIEFAIDNEIMSEEEAVLWRAAFKFLPDHFFKNLRFKVGGGMGIEGYGLRLGGVTSGMFRPGPAYDLIHMFNSRDPLDFLHELGHRQMLRLLEEKEVLRAVDIWKKSDAYREWARLDRLRKTSHYKLSKKQKWRLYKNSFEEWFADEFRNFVGGKITEDMRPEMKKLYSKVRDILAKLYKKIRATLRNKEMVEFFDAMLLKKDPNRTKSEVAAYKDFINSLRRATGSTDTTELSLKLADIEGFEELYKELTSKEKPLTKEQIAEIPLDATQYIEIKGDVLVKLEEKSLEDQGKKLKKGFEQGARAAKTQIKQAKKNLRDLLKQSSLSPESQRKIMTLAKIDDKIQSGEGFLGALNEINSLIDREIERVKKVKLKKRLDKLLSRKNLKPKIVSGVKHGKFDAEIQVVLDELQRLYKLSTKVDPVTGESMASLELAGRLETTFNRRQIDENELSKNSLAINTLGNQLLWFRTNPDMMTSDMLEMYVNDIETLIAEGKEAEKERVLGKRLEVEFYTDAIKDFAGGEETLLLKRTGTGASFRKTKNWFRNLVGRVNDGWDEITDRTLPGKLARKLEIGREIQIEKGIKRRMAEKLIVAAEKAYGVKGGRKLMKGLDERNKVIDYGDNFIDSRGKKARIEYSRSEMTNIFMLYQDPTLRETLTGVAENGEVLPDGNFFSQEMLDFMFSTITEEDKQFAFGQLEIYQEFYEEINEVYKKVYGINLDKNLFYSPILREVDGGVIDVDEFNQDLNYRRQVTKPPSIKARRASIKKLKVRSDVAVFNRHIVSMSRFIALREKTQLINAVYSNAKVQEILGIKYGEDFNKLVSEHLISFVNGANMANGVFDKMVNTLNRNFSASQLGGKAKIGFTQLASLFAYAEDIPATAFVDGVRDFFFNFRKAIKILSKSELIRARGYSPEVEIARIGSVFSGVFLDKIRRKKDRLIDYMLIATKIGDRIPIYVGGWAVYRYTLKQTGSAEKAMEAVNRQTAKTQQSTDPDQMSWVQKHNPLYRGMTMFMSAPIAQFRGEVRAFRRLIKGEGSARQALKGIMIYHFILPGLYQAIASGVVAGEWDKRDQIRAAIFGNLNSLALFGELMNNVIRRYMGKRSRDVDVLKWTGPLLDFVDGVGELGALFGDDGDFDEIVEAILDMGKHSGALHGLPGPQIKNIQKGLADLEDGELKSAVFRFLGWPESVAISAQE